MAVICSTIHKSEQFTYNAETKTFSVEASDFCRDFMSRVYDDACDEGFGIMSERTGKVVVFALDKEHRNGEGELTHWSFVPVRGSVNMEVKAIVFND